MPIRLDEQTIKDIKDFSKSLLSSSKITKPPTDIDILLKNKKLSASVTSFKKFLPDSYSLPRPDIKAILDCPHKNIIVDEDLHPKQIVFAQYHELAHYVIDWHRETFKYCSEHDLSPSVRKQFELEANLFSAECIFQQDHFTKDVEKTGRNFQAILSCADIYGASYTSATRRYTETSQYDYAFLVVKPFKEIELEDGKNIKIKDSCKIRYFCRSPSFEQNYPRGFSIGQRFGTNHILTKVCHSSENLQEFTIKYHTSKKGVELKGEAFNNGYEVLVLLKPST